MRRPYSAASRNRTATAADRSEEKLLVVLRVLDELGPLTPVQVGRASGSHRNVADALVIGEDRGLLEYVDGVWRRARLEL